MRRTSLPPDGETWGAYWVNADTIQKCFDDVLEPADLRPTADEYKEIAAKILRFRDFHHNEKNRVFDDPQSNILSGRNVSLQQIEAALYIKVRDAAARLYEAIEIHRHYAPVGEPFDMISDMLFEAGTVSSVRALPPVKLGQPKKEWRTASSLIGQWVSNSLRNAAYKGSLSATVPDSVTAEIGAKIIGLSYGIEINADQFADAVKKSSRYRGTVPRYPFESSLKIQRTA